MPREKPYRGTIIQIKASFMSEIMEAGNNEMIFWKYGNILTQNFTYSKNILQKLGWNADILM